ncbi:hypothetical protein Hamer_G013099 [Homarus americanus]|uniref:Uncharacterized protein n=1 Tax=Homarus americanus TaxID=6706 RepID=A0A8J5JWJ4_HOMAM|nr:hypothetical protein Hamer_G013099 [Homarus americanus]
MFHSTQICARHLFQADIPLHKLNNKCPKVIPGTVYWKKCLTNPTHLLELRVLKSLQVHHFLPSPVVTRWEAGSMLQRTMGKNFDVIEAVIATFDLRAQSIQESKILLETITPLL